MPIATSAAIATPTMRPTFELLAVVVAVAVLGPAFE